MTITRTATIAAILTAASAGAALADWPTDRPIEICGGCASFEEAAAGKAMCHSIYLFISIDRL